MKFAYLTLIFFSFGAIWTPVSYAANLNEGKDTAFFELLQELKTTISEGICADDIQQCEDQQICRKATTNGAWNSEEKSKKYVKEAQRREMSCGVLIDFRQIFSSQTKLKRQQLQYALKKLNFYNYGIDGLWGRGTEAGFQKFRKEFNLGNANEVFQALLRKVEVPSSFAQNVTVKKKSKILNPFSIANHWQVTCTGSDRKNLFQEFARVTRYNKLTGKVDFIITDANGATNSAHGKIKSGKLNLYNDVGKFNSDFTKIFLKSARCPGEFLWQALTE